MMVCYLSCGGRHIYPRSRCQTVVPKILKRLALKNLDREIADIIIDELSLSKC